ncbi:hypothetical protein [Mangrovihabitans endophyticus]|uniref:WXG100 family type VII secretion target n=1 Tax=Mangrovihabitans endophyticus TaxID=1751298 RepID=A0A8J3FS34_9ACTN|nr:hypothetical protein [Mangrovihabitans endophyticus]GGL11811.1 hypothetical protein GCM10012284_53200 [Mangrovihabitans endophyticus]
MTVMAYSNLGFDPCPGSTDSVAGLRQKISQAATSLRQANDLMHRLRNDTSGAWQGPAGDAFRAHLDATLIDDLGKANQSLNQAVGALQDWGVRLTGFQQQAATLEHQAADAQHKVAAATTAYQNAAANPDLKLAGRYFTTETALRDAQQRIDAAALTLRNATTGLDAATDELDAIRKKAQDLHDQWDQASSAAAGRLADAARFAPHQPGLLARIGSDLSHAVDGVGDWVTDHLDDIHSVLSTVSAVAGLVALCTPPPIDAVAFAVSMVAGAGALATTLADPAMRGQLNGLLHGHVAGNWHAGLQLTGDALGLVPGVAAGVKMAKAGNLMADAGRGFPTVVDVASRVSHDPGVLMRTVADRVPAAGPALEKIRLLEPTLGADTEATADMLNLLNKTRGGIQKTATTAWNEATGGNSQ